jgi:hypothetical protein
MILPTCQHCGFMHSGVCSRIKSIEYYANGTIKRVEYHQWLTVAGCIGEPQKSEPVEYTYNCAKCGHFCTKDSPPPDNLCYVCEQYNTENL